MELIVSLYNVTIMNCSEKILGYMLSKKGHYSGRSAIRSIPAAKSHPEQVV